MKTPIGRTLALATWILAAGCDSRGGGGPWVTGDLRASSDDGGSEPRDGAMAEPDLAQAGPITLTRVGLVELRAASLGVPADRHGSAAGAQLYDLSQRGDKCTRSVVGACLFTQCGSTLRPPQQSAGTIRLEGGQIGVSLSFNNGQYLSYSADGVLNWPVGAPITVSAPGADVPGFSAVVAMPARVVVTAPERPQAGVNFALQRTADVNVTWDGGGKGFVWFVATAGAQTLECGFPAAAGRGVVPAAGLGLFPSASGTLELFTADTKEVVAGEHRVRVRAAYDAAARDGLKWQAQLVLL